MRVSFPALKVYFYCERTDSTFEPAKEYEDYIETYENGQIKTKGKYHWGYKDGIWKEWYPSGRKKSVKEYRNGVPTGKWRLWNEDGKLIDYLKIKISKKFPEPCL